MRVLYLSWWSGPGPKHPTIGVSLLNHVIHGEFFWRFLLESWAGGYAKLRNWTGCLPLANRLILVETLGPFLLASFWTLQRSIFWCHAGGSKNFRMFFSVHAKHGRCRSFTYWHVETVSRTSLTQMPVAQCNYHFGSCTAARYSPPNARHFRKVSIIHIASKKKKTCIFCLTGSTDKGSLQATVPRRRTCRCFTSFCAWCESNARKGQHETSGNGFRS